MHQPFEGIRILEWGIFHAGPGGTAILGEMGAEVIKIEQPGTGDPTRRIQYKNIGLKLNEKNSLFYSGSNRSKKSITLNLEHPQGKQIAYNLAKKSDVFFTNLRRSTVKKMGMDFESLSRINPELIYASVTGFGSQGPDADRGGFDYQGQGRSGLMYSFGGPELPPLMGQFGIVDQATAIMASYEIMAALYMRERFGVVQEVDVSLLGTASYLLYFNFLVRLVTGVEIPRHDQMIASPLRNYYRCQDGKYIVQTLRPDTWKFVCRILGHPELADDPRYDSELKILANSAELVPIFNEAFATKPRDEWLRLFAEENLIICSVNTISEAIDDPQMMVNDYITESVHREMGPLKVPGFPIHFSQAEIKNGIDAPELGEHTEVVLKELGGYSDEEIAGFRKDGVI